ncbi:unnamed protein product [Phyllotreta striolata]|uniref:CUB domain-containing protein n=1 Tax=Phyllotreta striolata TaxID=444603 RepID=A0A9N9TN21_PHYSR|nr:unnamed protein product [Phyllotreta striolata]
MSPWLCLVMVMLAANFRGISPGPACRISEFPCRNGRCVRLNAYCDGTDDCGDVSDEPPFCTVCNRTYYGDVGKTYELKVSKQPDAKYPFLCHLTFTANGQNHGDIIQLIFDEFKIGRYESTALDGCPDGYMQLSELGRPFTGGSWCGAAAGPAAYYSETATVTATVKLFPGGAAAEPVPFAYRLRYRFFARREAVVRFGSPAAPLERGQIAPGTYCTRQFEECYRKPCRLQSPNYPGMYPRNVSCYWSLRQKFVPTCKHAMISVRQEAVHKMQMKRSINLAGLNKTERLLKAWRDCTGERDHLIFYDGGSTNDAVLAKYCGGDWLPRVVSRGPEMLVAFHSSPFSIPLRSPSSQSPLRGFELDVEVVFVDSDSMDFSRHPIDCLFYINATSPDSDEVWTGRGRRGRLSSPKHSLPPNTTCVYRFQGYPEDLVWISFISYSHKALLLEERMGRNDTSSYGCSTRIKIWDGLSVIEDKCDEPPKLCDHSALSNASRTTRPCSKDESYLTIGRNLMIQHYTEDGTALHPASFKLAYEFVDTKLAGEPAGGRCDRVLRRQHVGDVLSPKNVFLFGRGGAKDLDCSYRFEAGRDERVRLTFYNASFGGNPACETVVDAHTGRHSCEFYPGGRVAELSVFELPWEGYPVPKLCLCDNSTLANRPLVFASASRTVELRFTAKDMNVSDDFTVIHFHLLFELVKMDDCSEDRRLGGYGGDVRLDSEASCAGMPWLVEARHNRSLFLLSWGAFLPLKPRIEEAIRCPSSNRILVYSGRPPKLVRVVCPAEPGTRPLAVHVFSDEWWGEPPPRRPPNFLVEWIGAEAGAAAFSWLEISRPRSSLMHQLQVPANASGNDSDAAGGGECAHKCPELDACIGAELWCDGKDHCPSGYDEAEANCGAAAKLLNALPLGAAAAAAGAAVACCAVCGAVCAVARRSRARHRRRMAKKKLLAGPKLLDGLDS